MNPGATAQDQRARRLFDAEHGVSRRRGVAKLANLMVRDIVDLYLP